jgi:hypothetical protein
MRFLIEKQVPGLEIREGQYHFSSKAPAYCPQMRRPDHCEVFTSLTNPTKPTHMTPVRDFFTRAIGRISRIQLS